MPLSCTLTFDINQCKLTYAIKLHFYRLTTLTLEVQLHVGYFALLRQRHVVDALFHDPFAPEIIIVASYQVGGTLSFYYFIL